MVLFLRQCSCKQTGWPKLEEIKTLTLILASTRISTFSAKRYPKRQAFHGQFWPLSFQVSLWPSNNLSFMPSKVRRLQGSRWFVANLYGSAIACSAPRRKSKQYSRNWVNIGMALLQKRYKDAETWSCFPPKAFQHSIIQTTPYAQKTIPTANQISSLKNTSSNKEGVIDGWGWMDFSTSLDQSIYNYFLLLDKRFCTTVIRTLEEPHFALYKKVWQSNRKLYKVWASYCKGNSWLVPLPQVALQRRCLKYK